MKIEKFTMEPTDEAMRQRLIRGISNAERLACMATLSKLVDASTYGREPTTCLSAKHIISLLSDSHSKAIEMETVEPEPLLLAEG